MARGATLVSIGLSAVAISLIIGGVSHIADGRARDAAIPVPTALLTGETLPSGAYRIADRVLSGANPKDGEATIFRAEANMHLSHRDQSLLLEQGLSHAPAFVRGWILLALSKEKANPARAAQILSQALVLAPHDYWVVGMRAEAAALLWNKLDPDSQAAALEQARLLWDDPALRPKLLKLLSSPSGAALVSKAFEERHDDIVSINRWVSAQRRMRGG